jgi:hypothetical protein
MDCDQMVRIDEIVRVITLSIRSSTANHTTCIRKRAEVIMSSTLEPVDGARIRIAPLCRRGRGNDERQWTRQRHGLFDQDLSGSRLLFRQRRVAQRDMSGA